MAQSRFFSVLWLVWLTALAGQAQAFTMRLSQADLNELAQAAFPQTQYFNNIEAVFTQPQIMLKDNNGLAMEVTLTAHRGEQKLVARAGLDGTLRYSREEKTIQLIKPQLTKFDVLEQNLGRDAALLDQVKQLTNQPAPLIMLFDFSDSQLPLLGNQLPRTVHISNQQLVIEL